jgi:hypothetical protein
MKRPLLTLVLSGIVGSMILVADAEACHKRKCGGGCAQPAPCQVAPAPCAKPVASCKPAPCARPVAACKPAPCARPVVAKCTAPRVKTCGHHFPKLCVKRGCAPAPVVIACASPTYCPLAPAGYPAPSSQASPQR